MSTRFQATIEHVSHTTSRATVRTHTCLVDRGIAKGGSDLGPAGGEYMLVSLGGCFTSHLLAAIRAREAKMTQVKVDVRGTMDGLPEQFVSFAIDVTAECDDTQQARKLVIIAARSCQVSTTLRRIAQITFSYKAVPLELDDVS